MTETPTGPRPTMSGPALAAALRGTAEQADGLWLAVRGQSMGRAMATGDEVHVVASASAPAAGEVWAFCTPSGLVVVHRCQAPGPPHRFRGDARLEDDAPVDVELVIGRVDRIRTATGERSVPAMARPDRAERALRAVPQRVRQTVRKSRRRIERGVRSRRWKRPRKPPRN